MIDQAYQSEIDKNLDDQQRRTEGVRAAPLSMWANASAGLGGFIAGPMQGLAGWADLSQGASQVMGATEQNGAGGMFSVPSDAEQKQIDAAHDKMMTEGVDFDSAIGTQLRTRAKDFMPDPQATGKAGQIIGGLTNFAGQAVPASFAGPPGLLALGGARGMQKAEDLKEQGVDPATRMVAGVTAGALDAASMVLPMTGYTRLIAAGKGAAGGVATGIAQTQAEKMILQASGYDKLASTYDPFDPVSIVLSGVVPFGAGFLHAPTAARAPGEARAEPTHSDVAFSPEEQAHSDAVEASTIDVDIASLQREISGQKDAGSKAILQAELERLQKDKANGPLPRIRVGSDEDAAARVQQASQAMDRARLTPDDDLAGHEQHQRAMESAADQIARGEPVDVSDIVDTGRMEAARANAMRDRLNDTSSMLPAADDEHIAKLAPEAQEQLRGMYADAAREKGGFDATLSHLADEVGGKVMSAPLKGTARATAKIVSDYAGDPTRIKDLLRSTIEVHSAEAASHVIAGIRERYGIKGERNLLDPAHTPIDGYRDAKFNVDVNGHTAEIQVNVPQMMAAKKIAHVFYEQREALSREAQGRTLTPEEQARFDELNAKMRAVYEPAWAEATMPRNADSEIGMPLRRIESEGKGRGEGGSQATHSDGPAPALNETGTPSTSKNSARGENLAGRESSSDFIGTSDESLHLAAVASAADEILRSNPGLMVQLDGMDHPMRAEDLLNAVREAAAEEAKGGSLLEVAAQCAISL